MGRKLQKIKLVVLLSLLALSLLYLVGPPTWMLFSSVSRDSDLRVVPPYLIPPHPTLEHYRTIFQLPGYDVKELENNLSFRFFLRAIGNSLVIAGSTMVLCMLLGSVQAYSLSRFVRSRTRKWVMLGLLASRMLPLISVLIPIYIFLQLAGLLDTLTGLILAYTGLLMPFTVWILEGFYRSFPLDLEESAMIDGASAFGVFWRIVLPLSLNGLFATGAFVFISTWSDFIVGLLMTSTEHAFPISVIVARGLSTYREPDWGIINAAGLFAALIPAAIAFALRRVVMRGLFSGAMKG